MENNFNVGDILQPRMDVPEKFETRESTVPGFIKEAAYTYDETREQTIQKDYELVISGLSDFVMAEQLTERELTGMGKPLAENYAAYFNETLAEVKKNRKKAEQRLFKLIPRHSQLDTREFFGEIKEQAEKEAESKERAMELYPHPDHKGMKKEADANWTAPDAVPGSQTNMEPASCDKCKNPVEAKKGLMMGDKVFCMQCHDAGHSVPDNAAAPPKPAAPAVAITEGVIAPLPDAMLKEASHKWKPGQALCAKENGATACVAYVNEDDKTYIIKVDGTMYPSYYAYEDAHQTFDAVK